MDMFTLAIRGWHLDRSSDQPDTHAFAERPEKPLPQIHHFDQGLQYAATNYTDLLKQHHIQVQYGEC